MALRPLRRCKPNSRWDVVFVTATSDPRTRARAAAAQPAGFILKLFSSEELLNAVATAERLGFDTLALRTMKEARAVWGNARPSLKPGGSAPVSRSTSLHVGEFSDPSLS